ncbi:RNA polymerase II transcription factor B subunit 4 [Xylographa carneopallida]|nr:RNA polymerase II transcription factor B subunit 4 [Xylographa carneopallida]
MRNSLQTVPKHEALSFDLPYRPKPPDPQDVEAPDTANMDAVDGTEHYEKTTTEPPTSLLVIVLDTNPHGWALLEPTLTLSQAVANLLVFINAHLAINNANTIAVIASHIQRADYLYPPRPSPPAPAPKEAAPQALHDPDTEMGDDDGAPSAPKPILTLNGPRGPPSASGSAPSLPRSNTAQPTDDANIYRPFHQVSTAIFASLERLLATTTVASLAATQTTALAGALSLALSYINKQNVLLAPTSSTSGAMTSSLNAPASLVSRILVLSVSAASADQYLTIMNCIFGAQRVGIPVDVLSLAGASSFLQQASDATNGTFVSLDGRLGVSEDGPPPAHGILPTLLISFLPDATSRAHLISSTQASVDFRAACFCHRKVVDIGFVCSICLSIFCEPPERAVCLTCGTHLRLGDYGAKPAVVMRKKGKKKDKGKREGTGKPVPG